MNVHLNQILLLFEWYLVLLALVKPVQLKTKINKTRYNLNISRVDLLRRFLAIAIFSRVSKELIEVPFVVCKEIYEMISEVGRQI